jgi:hypothetical protein
MVHVQIEHPELLSGLLILELAPSADAGIFCIPTNRTYNLRSLGKPEMAA